MKKTLLVLLILVVLAAGTALIFTFTRPPVSAVGGVDISFMEFTNTPAGPSARLAVHFGPRFSGCGWNNFETSRRVEGAWQSGFRRATGGTTSSSTTRAVRRAGATAEAFTAC